MLTKIISDNPNSWKIDNDINVEDYQQIRRKLLFQAQLAWRSGRHKDAKIIMAKARRYKLEINKLVESRKINIFMRNNRDNNIINMINNREHYIDLHGLNYEEAKIIVLKKISDIKAKQDNGIITSMILNIITGVGHHSKNNQPVLLPRLQAMLKQNKHHIKIMNGIIKVFL
jgi:DNA-nicking Smr family endonuclease